MTELKCTDCGHDLVIAGVQPFDYNGTEGDLAHCVNPDCELRYRTHTYNVRPMSPATIAARRKAIVESVAAYGAATINR
jgi:hypothetical protein